MARRRFFVDRVHDGRAELAGDEARHLSRVLRASPGQRYEISDNRALYLAEITEATAQRVVFRMVEPLEFAEPPVEIILLAALIKFDRFEWIVEKATELGVTKIIPTDCERSEKGLARAAEKRRERWQRVARESSQQSRRVHLPEIAAPAAFEQAIAVPAKYRFALEEIGRARAVERGAVHRTASRRYGSAGRWPGRRLDGLRTKAPGQRQFHRRFRGFPDHANRNCRRERAGRARERVACAN